MIETTDDTVLGGRVRLRQPRVGYRAAIDPVLLAAAVPAAAGDLVLDVGAGVGTAGLCLASRVPGCRVVGLEIQRALVQIAGDNVAANGFDDRITMVTGDLARPPPRLAPASFAHVMANPPYLERERADPSPDPSTALATVEGEADLGQWLRFALLMVRSLGTVTVIHRADRLDAILAALHGRAGDIAVHPLWPASGRPARRVIVQARRDGHGPTRLSAGLVLHGSDGRYSPEAEAMLRDGRKLDP